jgi:membrane protein involved in colicin uptake
MGFLKKIAKVASVLTPIGAATGAATGLYNKSDTGTRPETTDYVADKARQALGREPSQKELADLKFLYNQADHSDSALAKDLQDMKAKDEATITKIKQDYKTIYGEPMPEDQVAAINPELGITDAIAKREQMQADKDRAREAEYKAQYEKDKADALAKEEKATATAKYESDKRARLDDIQSKVNQYAASVGGVSPSELQKIQTYFETNIPEHPKLRKQ